MSKKSAIENELNIIIVLNNLKDDKDNKYNDYDYQDVIKKKEIEMVPLSRHLDEITTIEENEVLRGGSITELRSKLSISNSPFLIKNRKSKTDDVDIFEQILKYMNKTKFCNIYSEYINKSIKKSDFIIFINNGIDDLIYIPMCIAFIQIYKDEDDYQFLYISLICSDEEWGQCGKFLMDTIKYIATLLNCNEIRLYSMNIKNTIEFYKRNKFININSSPVDYSHYYQIVPEDAVFKSLNPIQGDVKINPWYLPLIQSDESDVGERGGKKRKTKKCKNNKNKNKSNKCKKSKNKTFKKRKTKK